MSDLEMKVDALIRLATAEDSDTLKKAKEEIFRLMDSTQNGQEIPTVDYENEVRRALLELGVPDHIVGHQYLIDAILMNIQNEGAVANLTKPGGVYCEIGRKHDTTQYRVERAIRHAVEVGWSRSDLDAIFAYFGNTVSPEKGKPTNGEFIARVSNAVRMRVKEAA